jgi:hypothetical protein
MHGPIVPEILEIPAQKMAVVRTTGDPNTEGPRAMTALYSAVYSLKFALKKRGKDLKIGPLRARWPNAHLVPRDEWVGIWALQIPDDTDALSPKVPGLSVSVDLWQYGTVAQLLHVGPYSTEGPTVQHLHEFIAAAGYRIDGAHEEEYLTKPGARQQKTLIRYPVRLVEE